jgi:hypothetical protein
MPFGRGVIFGATAEASGGRRAAESKQLKRPAAIPDTCTVMAFPIETARGHSSHREFTIS